MSDDSRPESDPVDEVAPVSEASSTDVIVEAWFATHFHNSIISRDTETFNHVRAAIDDLKLRLNAGA